MTTYNSLPTNEHDVNLELVPQETVFQWTKQWYPVAVVDFLMPTWLGHILASLFLHQEAERESEDDTEVDPSVYER